MALKEPPAGKKGKGLRKLPKAVRNKMGFLKEGGSVMPGSKKKMLKRGGMAKKKAMKKKRNAL